AGEQDIFPDGPLEKEIILQYDAQLAPVTVQADLLKIYSINSDFARIWIQEGGDQSGNGCLARARTSHQGRDGTRRCQEINIVKDLLPLLIGKTHVFKFHFPANIR